MSRPRDVVTADGYRAASQSLAGGVCGAFRVNWATGQSLVVVRGDGPYVVDLQGRRLTDFSMSMGCMVLCDHFYRGLREILERRGFKATLQHLGARFSINFGLAEQVWNYREAAFADLELTRRFYVGCVERGVYFHSSRHHGLSIAHERPVLDRALEVIDHVAGRLA
mgnify:CR=1 FL=1